MNPPDPLHIGIIVHPNIGIADPAGWSAYKKELEDRLRRKRFILTRIEHSEAAAEQGEWPVDYMVSIGGDGTFLTTARVAATFGIPMIGVRVPASPQSKPFLPDIEPEDMIDWLVKIRDVSPEVKLERRNYLKATILKNGFGGSMSKLPSFVAVNEVSIGKSELKGTVTVLVKTSERGSNAWQDVLSVRCDLTMVSTSTGSTGYAMSTGGPLIHPEDASVVCAHVAPIGFGQRPVVLPGKYDVRMVLTHAQNAAVSFDCQNETPLEVGDQIYIERGNTYTVLRNPAWSFFERAKDVLNWGG